MGEKRSLPDMTDMFVAGVPLQEAVSIRHAIESQPDTPVAYWWELVTAYARSPQGNC